MNYDLLEERTISSLHQYLETYGLPNDGEISELSNSISEWYEIEDEGEWTDLMDEITGIIEVELKTISTPTN